MRRKKINKTSLTMEEHLEIAEKIHIMKNYIVEIYFKCQTKSFMNKKIMYHLEKCLNNKNFDEVKNLLDDEYCKIVSEEDLRGKYGFIYYDSRYFKNIKNSLSEIIKKENQELEENKKLL